MVKRPHQRVAVFIDTQNMYHSAKHIYGARVNFGALVDAAVANRPVVRAIAYVAKSKTGEEHGFFEALVQHGIELKVKDVQEFASGEKKADWDVGMAVDAMALAISGRVDVVILVTGDGDFCPLADFLRANGILCEVVAFGSSTNAQLKERADSFLDLSSDPTVYLIHSARAQRGPRHVDHAGGTPHAPEISEAPMLPPLKSPRAQQAQTPKETPEHTLESKEIVQSTTRTQQTTPSTRGRSKQQRGRSPSANSSSATTKPPSSELPPPTRNIRVTY